MAEFTNKQVKKYLKNPTICPNCKENTIKVDEEFTEETMSRVIICKNDDCGIKFNEVYELKTIEKID